MSRKKSKIGKEKDINTQTGNQQKNTLDCLILIFNKALTLSKTVTRTCIKTCSMVFASKKFLYLWKMISL